MKIKKILYIIIDLICLENKILKKNKEEKISLYSFLIGWITMLIYIINNN